MGEGGRALAVEMSGDDAHRIQAWFEAIRQGADEDVFELLDPAITWEPRADLPDTDVSYRGREGVRRLFASFQDVMDEIWFEPRELIEAGGRVVAPLRWGGRGKGSGVGFEEREETWVFTLSAGRIVHVKEYATKSEALEAIDVSG